MLKMRVVLAIILLSLLVGDAIARSKYPTPSTGKYESRIPQTHAENGQQPPATDQRGTEQLPLFVKIIGAEPKAQNRARDNADEGQKKPPTDWWNIAIGGGTLFVLGLQLIAFTAQACYMRRTVTEMQSTTGAAIRAANAAEGTICHMRETAERQLRAYVSGAGGSISLIDMQLHVQCRLKNFGQTPAYKASMWTRLEIFDTNAPIFSQHAGVGNFIIGPGAKSESQLECPISCQELADIRAEKKAIFIWGEIKYVDAFGMDRHFRFYDRNGFEIPGKGWPVANSDKPYEAN